VDGAGRVAADGEGGTADPAEAAGMAWYGAQAASRLGRYGEALATVGQALDSATLPAVWRGRLRARNALTLWNAGRAGESAALARQAAADGARTGDGITIGQAGQALLLAADRAGRLVHLDRALAGLGDDPESILLRLSLLENRALTLTDLDRPAEAEAAMREALVLAERAGSWLPPIQVTAAVLSYETGNWDEALVQLDPVAPLLGHRELLLLHGLRAVIAGRRED